MLSEILTLQDKLNSRFNLSQKEMMAMSEKDRMTWLRRYMEALYCEGAEVLTEAQVRWWKDRSVDSEKLKEEVVDLGHFFFCVVLASGMDADEFYQRYCNKNKKNHIRTDWDINQDKTS